ncbi:MAG: TetR/AcrR family transcriptional regulator [Deltaproteobacteria bacterium]|nr:TetR/AcrR family transcriptional regulator [Deltaproteobacteria bacterium]
MASNDDSRNGVRARALRSDAKQSRATLLSAARELFAERGPEALTVAAVAKRAGLNRSTTYQHFRNRGELLKAVGADFASEIRDLLREPRPIGEQIDFFVHYFHERPDIARLWMFDLLAENNQAGGWSDYVGSLERLAQRPRSQDGVDAEMLGVIGMTSALVWSLMARQRSGDEETARAETERLATELKRLFLFGALRPEAWPELAAEFELKER